MTSPIRHHSSRLRLPIPKKRLKTAWIKGQRSPENEKKKGNEKKKQNSNDNDNNNNRFPSPSFLFLFFWVALATWETKCNAMQCNAMQCNPRKKKVQRDRENQFLFFSSPLSLLLTLQPRRDRQRQRHCHRPRNERAGQRRLQACGKNASKPNQPTAIRRERIKGME